MKIFLWKIEVCNLLLLRYEILIASHLPYRAVSFPFPLSSLSGASSVEVCLADIILFCKSSWALICGTFNFLLFLILLCFSFKADHTLLLQGGEMTTQLLQGERKRTAHLLPGARQRSMMKIRSGGPTLLPVEMMLTMVMRSKLFIATHKSGFICSCI